MRKQRLKSKPNNITTKKNQSKCLHKGLIALAITGVGVSIGIGTTVIKKQIETRKNNRQLEELENEQFED